MLAFLKIASRVEAAAAAYISIQGLNGFADDETWRAEFKKEFNNVRRELKPILDANNGKPPPMHPILIALSIVIADKQDLSHISRDHPDRQRHSYYDASADFSADISDLLPPSEDRWWEALAESAHREHDAEATSPQPPQSPQPPDIPQQEITVVVTAPQGQPEAISATQDQPDEEDGDAQMEVDEEIGDSQSHGGLQVAKGPTNKRKRKGSVAPPSEGAKRRTRMRERPDRSEECSGESSASANPHRSYDSKYYNFTCDLCDESKETCRVELLGPCRQCKEKKVGCSLMPTNKKTKRPIRRKMTIDEVFEFRMGELEKRRAKEAEEAKKGKGRAHSPLGTSELEASVSAPSPTEPLTGLRAWTLESAGSSSAANTPADSPVTAAPLPERPASAPLSGPKRRQSTRRPKTFIAEVSPRQRFPNRTPRRASPSPSGASPVSAGASNAARFAAIERRLDALENLVQRSSPPPSAASPASGDISDAARFVAIEGRLGALEKLVHAQVPS